MIIEDLSLSAHGYQLLLLTTNYLVGYYRDIDVSDIC